GALIADTEVAREAYGEAERLLADARRDAERIRAEADDYVDQKLANFEVVLTKTLSAVGRGRNKMRGHQAVDDLGDYLKAQDEAEATGTHSMSSLQARLDADENAPFLGQSAPVPAQQQPGGYPEQPSYAPAAAAPPQPGGYYDANGYPQQQAPVYDQGGYESGGYEVPQYQQQVPYGTGQTAVPQQGVPQQGGHVEQRYDAALDETSFFDTSLIDVRQFRPDGRQG
ncbi:MAG: cell division initiation protein, partial [Streptomycetaceae bacterium]|nr:cell division initiation protein [Streptomycetaceae bacterium]